MKTLTFIFTLFVFSVICSAQCSNDKIIPVNIGITKAEALKGIKARSDISAIYDFSMDPDSLKYNYKRIYSYMQDTARVSRLRFSYKGNSCLGSDDHDVNLVFCNDKFYGLEVTIYYSTDEFKTCVSNYNRILSEFRESLPFTTEFDLTYKKIKQTVGEGLSFFKSRQESKKSKFERTDVLYRVRKVTPDLVLPAKIKKSSAEMYVLEINYVNLEYSEFNSSRF